MKEGGEKKTMNIPMCQELEKQRRGDLVGDVGHTHIKKWKLDFQDISLNDLQIPFLLRAFHTLEHLPDHSCVVFDGDYFLGPFKQFDGQIPCTRAHFKDDVCGS